MLSRLADTRPQPIGAVPMRGEAGFRPLMMGNPSAAQPGYISRYEYRHQQNDPFAGKGNPMSDGGFAQPLPFGGKGNPMSDGGMAQQGAPQMLGGLSRLVSGYGQSFGPLSYR